MTEQELIEAAQSGDRDAFAQLVEHEYALIFRIAMQWSGVRADAEDITQQACIKLARSLHQFRFESAFQTWLYRLVINCARDWQQSQARHHPQRVTAEPAGSGLDGRAAARDDAETLCYLEDLMGRVDQLGRGFRETLLLVTGGRVQPQRGRPCAGRERGHGILAHPRGSQAPERPAGRRWR